MKKITHKLIAKKFEISEAMVQHLLSGRRNASYLLAKKISKKTKSRLELWLLGGTGTPETRKAAIQNWAASSQKNVG